MSEHVVVNSADANADRTVAWSETPSESRSTASPKDTTHPTFVPQVDIIETGDGIVLYADLPGVPEDKLDITIDRNLLTIRGPVAPVAVEGNQTIHQEYGVGNYERTFTLSNEVDREGVSARFENGVLRLLLPKTRQAAPRKIQLAASSQSS